ncbi:MAG: hypothetical protein J7551_12435, partial [Chloroflexi bacterium]|nr:hypothetical protein [Chloroflexota bacterium]
HDPRAAVDWTMRLAKPMRGMPTAERRALLEQGLEAARRTRQAAGEAFLLRALYDVARQPEERALPPAGAGCLCPAGARRRHRARRAARHHLPSLCAPSKRAAQLC